MARALGQPGAPEESISLAGPPAAPCLASPAARLPRTATILLSPCPRAERPKLSRARGFSARAPAHTRPPALPSLLRAARRTPRSPFSRPHSCLKDFAVTTKPATLLPEGPGLELSLRLKSAFLALSEHWDWFQPLCKPCIAVQSWNPSTGEAETGGSVVQIPSCVGTWRPAWQILWRKKKRINYVYLLPSYLKRTKSATYAMERCFKRYHIKMHAYHGLALGFES